MKPKNDGAGNTKPAAKQTAPGAAKKPPARRKPKPPAAKPAPQPPETEATAATNAPGTPTAAAPPGKKQPPAQPTKEQRIAKEARRLKARMKGLDKNKLETAAPLIRNAARLTVAIDDIWDDYLTAEIGYVEEYDNGGGQRGKKPSEARKAINEMTKHHIAIMRILIELAPPAPLKRDALDDILDM